MLAGWGGEYSDLHNLTFFSVQFCVITVCLFSSVKNGHPIWIWGCRQCSYFVLYV